MMEGITILSEYTAGGVPAAVTVGCLIAFFLGAFILIKGCVDEPEAVAAVGAVIMLGGLIIGIALECATEDTHQRYEVLIDDTVPFVEFYERYEIIDQNGLIYEVRERNET